MSIVEHIVQTRHRDFLPAFELSAQEPRIESHLGIVARIWLATLLILAVPAALFAIFAAIHAG